ncbi:MAG: phosphate regulon sensor protein phoR [Pseudobdellovibrio sp.]|nr:phosphate regulon sensor protein phoR [Pseudobdellovibrio sp.]
MIQILLWILAIVVVSFGAYILSYIRFRRIIAKQTKQMIELMKSEDLDNLQIGDIFSEVDEDFSLLERAALTLRKKYLRLKRQSKEERRGYETVFSGLKEGIVTVDQNLRVISFNSAFMNFFQWAPLKETASYSLQDIIRDPQVITTFKKTFENSRFNRSEGDRFQLFVTPLPSRNENESWCLGVFYDLSELRKTEKIRIDFVANASHEMRTPLTVIKGYAELLKQKLEASGRAEELELLKPILLGTDQMSDLMSELLNLSKVETGTQLTKSRISTDEITKDVLGELEPSLQLTPKKINVQKAVSEVNANYDATKQIMRNLLINAVKYSGESNQIDLTWEPAGASVVLKVRDNGPGIAKEHQDRIFERFYRVDKGRNRDQGGFGLGLALVKHHMLNHGGNVKLISENGKGSEFICEFPN